MRTLILTTVALLAGCAGNETPWQSNNTPEEGSKWNQAINTEGMEQDCFYPREVNDYDSLNRVNLIAYGSGNSRSWLLTISPPSPSLRSNVAIQFDVNGQVCGRAGERMRIGRDDRGFAIVDVRRLNEDQLNRLRNEHLPARNTSEPPAKDGNAKDMGQSL